MVEWWDEAPPLDPEARAIRDELRREGWLVPDGPVSLRDAGRFYVSAFDASGTTLHGIGSSALEAYRELRWRIRRGKAA